MHCRLHCDPELPHPALQGTVVLHGQVDAQADAVEGALGPTATEERVEVDPTHLRPDGGGGGGGVAGKKA